MFGLEPLKYWHLFLDTCFYFGIDDFIYRFAIRDEFDNVFMDYRDESQKTADLKKSFKLEENQQIDEIFKFEQILGHMQDDIEYSCDEIAEAIGLKSPRTRQILNELVSMIKIIISGATKGRRYIKKSAEE